MSTYIIIKYVCWALSAILGLWMLFDMLKTDREYSEDLLMSSREGEIEDSMDGVSK